MRYILTIVAAPSYRDNLGNAIEMARVFGAEAEYVLGSRPQQFILDGEPPTQREKELLKAVGILVDVTPVPVPAVAV